ncbi:MAG: hypothetical protein DMF82_00465 [Acidobacteria bacterium]|nr:MAG: hypothetical protein DMF82_00465 [Acidobacteriota bacterium]
MGFSAIPPRNDQAVAIQAIDIWSRRADAAIISLEPPWAELLAGTDPATLVRVVQLPLATYYRSKGHELWIYLDPGNGLNRAGESDPLAAAGHSLTEPAVQMLGTAPMVFSRASRRTSPTSRSSRSSEGGWTSLSLGAIVSSQDAQRRYIVRHMELLDRASAIGVFQLTFTDLDLPALSLPADSILPLFAYNGLVDANLQPKPALSAWDEAFGRPLASRALY